MFSNGSSSVVKLLDEPTSNEYEEVETRVTEAESLNFNRLKVQAANEPEAADPIPHQIVSSMMLLTPEVYPTISIESDCCF